MEQRKEKNMPSAEFLSQIRGFPQQVEAAAKLGREIKLTDEFDKIIVAGMGGSGLPGDIIAAYPGIKLPVFVNKEYELPEFANSKTLVFAVSYSGNTEETISAFRTAMRKNCRIVGISSGGKLKEMCQKNSVQYIEVPAGMQPRMALGYLLIPVLNVLNNARIITGAESSIKETVSALKRVSFEEKAKSLAEKLIGKTPIIYASARLKGVAYRWKTDFNENSKVHAICNYFPELNHNELSAYIKLNAYYSAIILEDEEDSRRIKERMRLTKEIISKRGVEVTQIAITGQCFLSRALSAIYLGELTSYHLALLNKVDPENIKLQEEFKKSLSERKL